MQRRWWSAAVFGLTFTGSLAWFVMRTMSVLTAYYDFAFHFETATGDAPSIKEILWPFALSLLVYVLCLIDAAVASRKT